MQARVLFLLTIAAAFPAAAQTPVQPTPRDAIADILDHHVPLSKDEDEPDTAGQPRIAPDPEPGITPSGPVLPTYMPPPRSQLDRPVQIEEIGKTPDAPPTLRDQTYDSRIRASFASAESFQGPLDGGWTLSAAGHDLYALQLVDRRDRLEGVWRDVRRAGSLNASGLVDEMQRRGADVIVRFTPAPGAPTSVATLHDSANGLWVGELAEGGARRAVTLRRTGP